MCHNVVKLHILFWLIYIPYRNVLNQSTRTAVDGGEKMKLALSKFEVKNSDMECWQCVSEVDALEILQNNFEQIGPKIDEMLQGEEIETPNGIFRMLLLEN